MFALQVTTVVDTFTTFATLLRFREHGFQTKNGRLKGGRTVFTRSYEEGPYITHFGVFDFETMALESRPYCTPYAVSVCFFKVFLLQHLIAVKGERATKREILACTVGLDVRGGMVDGAGPVLFEGVICVEKALIYMTRFSMQVPHLKVYGFNSSRFDSCLLMQFDLQALLAVAETSGERLAEFKVVSHQCFVESNVYKQLEFRYVSRRTALLGTFKVNDIRSHLTPCSLREACASFKVPACIEKGDFNFFKIRSWEDVERWRGEWEAYVHNEVFSTAWIVAACDRSRRKVTSELLGLPLEEDWVVGGVRVYFNCPFGVFRYMTAAQLGESYIYCRSKVACTLYKDSLGKELLKDLFYGGKTVWLHRKSELGWQGWRGGEPLWLQRLSHWQRGESFMKTF